jgi:hypothetical protein
MNDDFLNQFYQPSPPAFSRDLYASISSQKSSPLAGKSRFSNLVGVLACIVLIVACVRAATAQRWTKIGSIWVDAGSKYEMGLIFPKTSTGSITNLGYLNISSSCGQDCISLSQAEKTCDCTLQIPTWAPDQFNWDGKVNPYWVMYGGKLLWIRSDDQSSITLVFTPLQGWNGPRRLTYEPYTDSAMPGSYQEVKVNGQSAVLIQGLWTLPYKDNLSIEDWSNPVWDGKIGLSLYWVENQVEYRLFTWSSTVSVQDLIQMAESAR